MLAHLFTAAQCLNVGVNTASCTVFDNGINVNHLPDAQQSTNDTFSTKAITHDDPHMVLETVFDPPRQLDEDS